MHANRDKELDDPQGYGRIEYAYSRMALAAGIALLVPVTVFMAITGRFEFHRAIARWTAPIWLYVTVSGVMIYVMAVHLYSPPAGP